MRISAIFVFCGVLGLSLATQAQDNTGGGTTDVTPGVSSFDQLSPGNQRIVESLFEGQSISGDGTGEAWTLDKISAAKQDGQGWGQIFKQMKSEGLIEAKNLGQLVSAHSKASRAAPRSGSGSATVITTGTGRTASFGKSQHADRGKGSQNRKDGAQYSGITSGQGARGGLHSSGFSRSLNGRGAGISSGGRGRSGARPKIKSGKHK